MDDLLKSLARFVDMVRWVIMISFLAAAVAAGLVWKGGEWVSEKQVVVKGKFDLATARPVCAGSLVWAPPLSDLVLPKGTSYKELFRDEVGHVRWWNNGKLLSNTDDRWSQYQELTESEKFRGCVRQ